MTPEQLREWVVEQERQFGKGTQSASIARAHAAALEEIKRLAARVRELERLVEVARNDMDSMRKRHADEMARYGCPFVNSVVSREDGHFIAHQIIETHPTPNGLTVVIADAARGGKP